MLQIILFSLLLIFSAPAFAQSPEVQEDAPVEPQEDAPVEIDTPVQAQENVPAFLKNEAQQGGMVPPQSMQFQQPQQGGNVPAFMQQEQEQQQFQQLQQQQQYNYQSADPNSNVFTLPPANYQPAPGDVPAFMKQDQNPQVQDQGSSDTLKTNKKEDVIQINFTDDQYKPEQEGVTTLDKDKAIEYNTDVQKESQNENATKELQEGAKFEGEKQRDSAAAVEGVDTEPGVAGADEKEKNMEHEKQAAANAVPEPTKSSTNMIRVSYSKDTTELTDKDKASLLGVVRMLKSSKQNKVLLRAYTSKRDIGADARKVGLSRIIGIRDFLMKQGVDFSQTEIKVIEPELNKEDLDYIDIDKI